MATNAIKKRLSQSEAADQLSQLARELRDGRISLGRETKLLRACGWRVSAATPSSLISASLSRAPC